MISADTSLTKVSAISRRCDLQDREQSDDRLGRQADGDGGGTRTHHDRLEQSYDVAIAVDPLDEAELLHRVDQGVVALDAGERCECVARQHLGAVVVVGQVEDVDQVERVARGGAGCTGDRLLDGSKRVATIDELADQLQSLQVLAVCSSPYGPRAAAPR